MDYDNETPKEVFDGFGINEVLDRWVMDVNACDFIKEYIKRLEGVTLSWEGHAHYWENQFYNNEKTTRYDKALRKIASRSMSMYLTPMDMAEDFKRIALHAIHNIKKESYTDR